MNYMYHASYHFISEFALISIEEKVQGDPSDSFATCDSFNFVPFFQLHIVFIKDVTIPESTDFWVVKRKRLFHPLDFTQVLRVYLARFDYGRKDDMADIIPTSLRILLCLVRVLLFLALTLRSTKVQEFFHLWILFDPLGQQAAENSPICLPSFQDRFGIGFKSLEGGQGLLPLMVFCVLWVLVFVCGSVTTVGILEDLDFGNGWDDGRCFQNPALLVMDHKKKGGSCQDTSSSSQSPFPSPVLVLLDYSLSLLLLP